MVAIELKDDLQVTEAYSCFGYLFFVDQDKILGLIFDILKKRGMIFENS